MKRLLLFTSLLFSVGSAGLMAQQATPAKPATIDPVNDRANIAPVSTPTPANVANAAPAKPTPVPVPEPDKADVAYGPHEKNKLDFWWPKNTPTDKPVPLLINIHGGGFYAGDKRVGLDPNLVRSCQYLGIALASINYRYSSDALYPAPMLDGVRALQYLRLHAKEFNIDPTRVGLCGGSAGAGMSLWIGFHPDFADPKSEDPVARQSTRVSCLFVSGAQCSYDPRWIKANIAGKTYAHPAIWRLFGVKEEEMLNPTPEVAKLYDDCNMIAFVTPSAPPVFMAYGEGRGPLPPDASPGHGIHHISFGLKLKEVMDAAGVECIILHPDDWVGKPANERPIAGAFLKKYLVDTAKK